MKLREVLVLVWGLGVSLLRLTGALTCWEGFEPIEHAKCVDVDTCLDEHGLDPCGENGKCVNPAGILSCQCDDGFSSTNMLNYDYMAESHGICSDINECIEDRNICGPNALCFNLIPHHFCYCKDGFASSNGTKEFEKGVSVSCIDVDECLQENICGKHATCTNSEGGYSCVCDEGFVLSGNPERCEDVDECDNGPCGLNTKCFNTAGSYYCQCEDGFRSSTNTVNFTAQSSATCSDINECMEDRNICGPNTVCSNLRPGYTCYCKDGFASSTGVKEFQKGVSCRDVDECLQENICGKNGACKNSLGSYSCVCDEGFVLFGNPERCEDINECLDEDDDPDFVGPCGTNAKCFNTAGSFYCQCEDGFRSSTNTVSFTAESSATCSVINECLEDRNICGANAECHNNRPGYTCSCKDGFASSTGVKEFQKGVSCRDVDECLQKNICGKNGTCTNSEGGYSCVCDEGFVLSGNPERCEDLLTIPEVSVSEGVWEPRAKGGVWVQMGADFQVKCSVEPQYPGGSFQLVSPTLNHTLPAVNHTAHFLFTDASPAHKGNYTCVYFLHVLDHSLTSNGTLHIRPGESDAQFLVRALILLLLMPLNFIPYFYYRQATRGRQRRQRARRHRAAP